MTEFSWISERNFRFRLNFWPIVISWNRIGRNSNYDRSVRNLWWTTVRDWHSAAKFFDWFFDHQTFSRDTFRLNFWRNLSVKINSCNHFATVTLRSEKNCYQLLQPQKKFWPIFWQDFRSENVTLDFSNPKWRTQDDNVLNSWVSLYWSYWFNFPNKWICIILSHELY